MAEAIFRVLRAGTLCTVQDRGRPGFERVGVTEGGPMDRSSHMIGQLLAGNDGGAAGLEIDAQGIALECVEGAVSFAFTGGDFRLSLGGETVSGWLHAEIREGQTLDISQNRWGNWCYLAFSGRVDSTEWLGSRSVNPGWSVSGERLKAGDLIRVTEARAKGLALRRLPTPIFARPKPLIHVVPGPQERFFTPEAFRHFLGDSFAVSSQYNRQGIRLDGPPLAIAGALDMPSEPIARGAIQVDGSGQASALMADHQTTGGYPKIATIVSADQDRLAQLRPRQRLRFAATQPEDAIARLRRRHARLRDYLSALL